MDIKELKTHALDQIKSARDLDALNKIYKRYLGKQGELTLILRSLKNLPEKQRKEQGRTANQIRQELEAEIESQKQKFQLQSSSALNNSNQKIDITAPGKKIVSGHLHPLTLVRRQTEEIFQ